jgi:hypothetical protein
MIVSTETKDQPLIKNFRQFFKFSLVKHLISVTNMNRWQFFTMLFIWLLKKANFPVEKIKSKLMVLLLMPEIIQGTIKITHLESFIIKSF